MDHPNLPTGDQCSAKTVFEWNGHRAMACWYPQMGGYVAMAVVLDCRNEGCFDAWVWHDGEFPFDEDDGRSPAHLHHCDADQFIEFGAAVKEFVEPEKP